MCGPTGNCYGLFGLFLDLLPFIILIFVVFIVIITGKKIIDYLVWRN